MVDCDLPAQVSARAFPADRLRKRRARRVGDAASAGQVVSAREVVGRRTSHHACGVRASVLEKLTSPGAGTEGPEPVNSRTSNPGSQMKRTIAAASQTGAGPDIVNLRGAG
jgi:hypothetical protein